MKKIAFALAAVATMLSTSAMAQAYMSGGLGVSHVNVDCSGAPTCDTNDTAVKLTGGYSFGNGFAAELGYINFGTAKMADSTASLNIKPEAFTIGGAYRAAINKDWAISARLGVASVKAKLSATLGSLSGSDTETHTQAYFGLNTDYAINKNVKAEIGADFTRAEFSGEKASVRALTVGLRYDF